MRYLVAAVLLLSGCANESGRCLSSRVVLHGDSGLHLSYGIADPLGVVVDVTSDGRFAAGIGCEVPIRDGRLRAVASLFALTAPQWSDEQRAESYTGLGGTAGVAVCLTGGRMIAFGLWAGAMADDVTLIAGFWEVGWRY